jgi:hypothetical protein
VSSDTAAWVSVIGALVITAAHGRGLLDVGLGLLERALATLPGPLGEVLHVALEAGLVPLAISSATAPEREAGTGIGCPAGRTGRRCSSGRMVALGDGSVWYQ